MWIYEYLEADKAKHTPEWGNKCIQNIRVNMIPLVDYDRAILGMSYLLNSQDMSSIAKLFQNSLYEKEVAAILDKNGRLTSNNKASFSAYKDGMEGVRFIPLPLWEKIRNIITAEMKKLGVSIDVRSTDPTSEIARKKDKALIKNKRQIETTLSKIHTSIGDKPYSMDHHEPRFGEKLGGGNIADFAKMGFSEQDPDDVEAFMNYFHKLDIEIKAESIANSILDFNEIDNKIDMFTTDLLSKKAVAAMPFVNTINGQMCIDRLAPECVYIYGGGRRKDFNDANAKSVEVIMSVREMLGRFGDSFDFKAHWDKLLMAIRFSSNVEVSGIHVDGKWWWAREGTSTRQAPANGNGVYSFNDFMQLRVKVGYVEFFTQDEEDYTATLDQKINQTTEGAFQNNQPKNGEPYQSKSRFQTPMYKSWYLPITTFDQILFDFGKIAYQDIEGYNDMENTFTIITWKEIGDPLSISTIAQVDLVNECWYKFKHEVRKAKPRGRGWNTTALLQMAEEVFWDTAMTKESKMQRMMQINDQSSNELYVWPEIEGKVTPIPGNQQNYDIAGGLNDQSLNWFKVMLECKQELIDMAIGNSPLREGNAPSDRATMNNEFKALENSENSTWYIPDGITFVCQALSKRIIMWTQNIVLYKDKDTLAYKFLMNLIGEDVIEGINGDDKLAIHRYGINVESIDQRSERMELKKYIELGIQNKTITTIEGLLLRDIKSAKKAVQALAYFEHRRNKIAQKAIEQAQMAQQQMEQQKMAADFNKIKLEGDYRLREKEMEYYIMKEGHLINQEGSITKQVIKSHSDSVQIFQQAEADMRADRAETEQKAPASAVGSGSVPPPQLPIQQQPFGGPQGQPQIPQDPRQSGIQQQMELAKPSFTGANQ